MYDTIPRPTICVGGSDLTRHSNLELMKVSSIAYIKSRMSLVFSKFKHSGPYELLSSCRLTAPGKRITHCVFDEWKRVRKMRPLARTHIKRSTFAFFCRDIIYFLLSIKNIYEIIFNFFF